MSVSVGTTIWQLVGAAGIALVLAGASASPSLAQSVSCTTLFGGQSISFTDCSGPGGAVNCTTLFGDTSMPMTDCTGPGLTPPPPQVVYVTPPPQVVYAAPPPVTKDPGIRFGTADSYGNTYLREGTLVKSDRAQAIYIVWGGQLRAFQTWDSYLRDGGHADLSNVLRYGDLGSYLTALIGPPVPR